MRRAAVALSLVSSLGLAQEPPEQAAAPAAAGQAPVFEVAVDIVAVDVSVVDGQGRPLVGLAPEDFEIEVDGRPRVVASAEYVGRESGARATAPAPVAHFSSNADASSGRLVLLVVDAGGIGRGSGRPALAAADRFLSSLDPADRVGLAVVPGPGPSVEFTADHARVRQALGQIVGRRDRTSTQVPLLEALALLRDNDRARWDRFVDQECRDRGLFERQLDQCQQELETEAMQVYNDYRERSLREERALSGLFRSLREIPGPKTVVLITEGLATDSPAEIRRLAELVSEAQATLFSLLLEWSGGGVQLQRRQPRSDNEVGALYDLTASARGAVMRVVGAASAPFERIARELEGYYLLGFEPLAGDRDGKSHSVKVRVKREGATVRARGLLAIPTAPPKPEEQIATALRSPFVERALPLRVTTYARPAAEGKVRLLLAAELGRVRPPVSVGFVLVGADGNVATSRLYEGITAEPGGEVLFSGDATVDPGRYELRLAALDAAGRRGSVRRDTVAELATADGLAVSDLMLASPAATSVRPVVDPEAGPDGVLALVELSGGAASRAEVAVELAESPDAAALLSVAAGVGPANAEGVRTASVTVASGLLPPGEYVARASVALAGRPVAVVTRPLRVTAPPAGTSGARAPLAALSSSWGAFERAQLLAPDELRYFIGRVGEIVPGPEPKGIAAATEEALAGRPEAMLARLQGDRAEDARVAFLRGVAYFAAGNLNAALTQLQAAMRTRSDLFPAAVYMGGCYAAGGKDQDAIGAWQTALIGESGSSTLYAVLGDALLRTGDAEEAVAVLDDGIAAFPDDDGLRRRLGLAHAAAGHPEQALALLGGWVEAHPEDEQALFVTLSLLFEGFASEAAGGATAEQRERLRRYAQAYLDGKGPRREVVERWLRWLDGKGGG